MLTLAPHALIVGCGYLGRVLARRLLSGSPAPVVWGTTRHTARAAELAGAGVRPMIVSVTQPVTFAALRPAMEADQLDLYYMVPPGRAGASPSPRQVILGGVAHVLRQVRHARIRRAALVSSTAVYGQRGGAAVSADTTPEPATERAQLLLEGERLWLAAGEAFHVVRLAGLYGPGRVIGRHAVADGAPIIGDPDALLNVIHVDDAADLLLAVMTQPGAGRVELGSDGRPMTRRAYYSLLARCLGCPEPRILDDTTAAARFGMDPGRLGRTSSKAIDPTPTSQRTGWFPAHRDLAMELPALLSR